MLMQLELVPALRPSVLIIEVVGNVQCSLHILSANRTRIFWIVPVQAKKIVGIIFFKNMTGFALVQVVRPRILSVTIASMTCVRRIVVNALLKL